MKKISLFFAGILLIFFTANLLANPQYYNFNNGTLQNSFPFNIAAGKMIQLLIAPGEFNQPSGAPSGNITQFSVWIGSPTYPLTTTTYTNFRILFLDTNLTALPSSLVGGNWDTVYYRASVPLTASAPPNWLDFTLDHPHAYDNTRSLVVQIEQCAAVGATSGVFSLTHTATATMRRTFSSAGCPFTYGGQSLYVPNCGVNVAPPVVNCNYTWGPQTSGVATNFFSIKAVNNNVAWASGVGASIRRTTDGGTTWGNGNPNPGVITGDVYNIEAIDANTAWCTTTPGATFIYKTTNGGTNWVQVYTLAAAFINAIKMVTPTTGIATGDPVGGNWLILGTTDGGSTWTPISSPAGTGDGRNNCLHVSLPNVWFGSGQGTVWRSTNAGVNWASSPTAPLTTQVLGLRFNSALIGLAGGSSLVRTTDGGVTWAPVTAPGTGNISGIDGSGSDFWYVRGTGIFRSTDAGLTFVSVHTGVGTGSDIKLANDPNGCLVGWRCASAGNITKMNGIPVGIGNNNNEIPSKYSLQQNYPNPFNPVTDINFSIPVAGFTELKVYDVLGREVAVLLNSNIPAGIHTLKFDALNFTSGVYFYTLKSGNFTETKKMVLLK